MKDLLAAISHADEEQIEMLLNAVLARYAVLYPNWEVSTISVEKTGDRNSQLDNIIRFIERMKHKPLT